jgi:hypothetical protein
MFLCFFSIFMMNQFKYVDLNASKQIKTTLNLTLNNSNLDTNIDSKKMDEYWKNNWTEIILIYWIFSLFIEEMRQV